MEQYEVADVMNRARAAVLTIKINSPIKPDPTSSEEWIGLRLDTAITSTNFVASEHGALKLTVAYPINFKRTTEEIFRSAQFEASTGLILDSQESVPHARSMMMRWGAHRGNVILPGDWYNFHGNAIRVVIPSLSLLPDPVYLIQAELFTVNSRSRKALFAIQRRPSSDELKVVSVDASNYGNAIESFWKSYHEAHERLRNPQPGDQFT